MPDDFVVKLSKTQDEFVFSDAVVNLIYSSKGEGKCLGEDTEIITFSGKIKLAKDVVVGDRLMGPDSTPRTVLSTFSGEGELFEIVPIKGESFVCNADHVLVLNHPRRLPCKSHPAGIPEKEEEITVRDFLRRGNCTSVENRLFRSDIKFPSKPVPVDPYFIGLWLGDGNSGTTAITTPDKEVVDYIYRFAKDWGANVREAEKSPPRSKATTYFINNGNRGPASTPLRSAFKKLKLFNNKHIPPIYLYNSREIRMRMLAGLIDSDGTGNHGGYDYITKRENLAKEIVYLCRSLGLAAYVKPCKKTIKSSNFVGDYFRIHISGDCSDIPTLIPRKKCQPRNQVKRVTITGIKEIKPLGIGKYCGFMLDGDHRFLLGNFIVSHNSFASIIAMIYHGKRCGRPVRWAIVRDSHENIKISTVRSIMDALPVGYYKFKNDFKHLDIYSDPPVSVDLFGIDDLSAVSKLQGPEFAGIWLEEPAPIADAANAGLSEDVYNAALASCARQKGTVPRLQISMNPGNQEHWTYRRFFIDPLHMDADSGLMCDPENPLITIRVFRVPVGENKCLSEIARQATRSAYANDPQSFERYAKGEFAKVYIGKKVTPDYNKDGRHHSQVDLEPAQGLIGFMSFDAWSNPACCLGQVTRTGRLIFLDTVRVLESDIRTLIKAQVTPLINSPRWKDKCKAWRTMGDCSMRQPDQSNKMESAAKVVEDAFGTIFEPGPKLWDHLKAAFTKALNENIKGLPAVVVNKSNRLLHDALSGSWHYKTDKAGNLMNNIPEKKSDASHIGDAFANACAVLMPEIGIKMDKNKWRELSQKVKRRAGSY